MEFHGLPCNPYVSWTLQLDHYACIEFRFQKRNPISEVTCLLRQVNQVMINFRVQVHHATGSLYRGSLRNGPKTGYPAKSGALMGAVSAEQKLDD